VRRHARALPLGRRRLGSLLGGLFLRPTENWPQHLRLAWAILIYELNISERTAIAVMASSVERANSCGQSISRLAGDIARFRSREQLVRKFKSVSKCVNRASSALRRRLDQVIVPLVQQGNIDLETIEGIFDNAVKVFDEYGREATAKTAIGMMTYQPPGGHRYMTVKNDFAGLGMKDRMSSERALLACALGRRG
jgi:hypothetical protein